MRATIGELQALHTIGLDELLKNDELVSIAPIRGYVIEEFKSDIIRDIPNIDIDEYMEKLERDYQIFHSLKFNIIDRVYSWNEDRGLLNGGYNKSLEASFIAEELSELLRNDESIEEVDSHIDSIIFQLGALSKILKSPHRVKRAFEIVLSANEQKSSQKDINGKIIKDKSNFIEPQEALKELLEEVV